MSLPSYTVTVLVNTMYGNTSLWLHRTQKKYVIQLHCVILIMIDSSLVSLCLCVCVSAQIIAVELLKEEESEIVQIIERSPTIVVFGQNAYVKSRIVNELFGKVVLPPLEDETCLLYTSDAADER